jgi:hypothetical protein
LNCRRDGDRNKRKLTGFATAGWEPVADKEREMMAFAVKPKKSPRERLDPNSRVMTVVSAGEVLGVTLSIDRVLLLVVMLYAKLKVGVKEVQGDMFPVQMAVSLVLSSSRTLTVE